MLGNDVKIVSASAVLDVVMTNEPVCVSQGGRSGDVEGHASWPVPSSKIPSEIDLANDLRVCVRAGELGAHVSGAVSTHELSSTTCICVHEYEYVYVFMNMSMYMLMCICVSWTYSAQLCVQDTGTFP
jgi:hypothetical protein